MRRAELIDAETAQRMIASVAVQLNVEMDLHALREKMAEETGKAGHGDTEAQR